MGQKIHHLFNHLALNLTLSVRTETKEDHERLRVRLAKLLSKHKGILGDLGEAEEISDKSLCAEYNVDSGISTFRVDVSKRNKSGKEYEIIGASSGETDSGSFSLG